QVLRNLPVATLTTQRRGQCQREGDEPDVGRPRFDKLGGLRHVLSVDEPRLNLIVQTGCLEGRFGGPTVGSVLGIGEGNLSYGRVEERLQAEALHVKGRVSRNPDDEVTDPVQESTFGEGQP